MKSWLSVFFIFILVLIITAYGEYRIIIYDIGVGVFMFITAIVLSCIAAYISYARGVGLPLEDFHMELGKVYFNHGMVTTKRERFAVITSPDDTTRMYRVGKYVPPIGFFKRRTDSYMPSASYFDKCSANGSPREVDITI